MPESAGRPALRARVTSFALWALVFFASCALIPLEESRFEASRLRFGVEHVPYAAGDVVFSHETHSFEPCETCHFSSTSAESVLEENELRAEAPADAYPKLSLPAMARCFQCHNGDDLSRDCITCHVTNRYQRKPRFHDGTWIRNHKHMAERESYKCSLCHVQDDCQGCHAVRKPLSHTPRFARSTHGRLATHDRRSCATCHEVSYCENCHSQPPPDHTPIFMGGGGHRQAALLRSRSCLVCHNFADSCAGCHNR